MMKHWTKPDGYMTLSSIGSYEVMVPKPESGIKPGIITMAVSQDDWRALNKGIPLRRAEDG